MHPDVHECGGAHGNQHVRSQTAAALPVLTLRADKSSEHESAKKADQRIEKIAEVERVQECHFTHFLAAASRFRLLCRAISGEPSSLNLPSEDRQRSRSHA